MIQEEESLGKKVMKSRWPDSKVRTLITIEEKWTIDPISKKKVERLSQVRSVTMDCDFRWTGWWAIEPTFPEKVVKVGRPKLEDLEENFDFEDENDQTHMV